MRGVLDASVLAPGLVSSQGAGSFLIKAARVARFDLAVSQYLLDEVGRCLTEDLGLSVPESTELVELVDRISLRVEPVAIAAVCRDPSDDPILALAAESGAFFLATYDHDLMAVGAIGACGVVHPQTAIQLVTAEAIALSDEKVPGVSGEDRSEWRYEDRGAPLFMAVLFLEWVRNLPANLEAGSILTTSGSWPTWQQHAEGGKLTQWMGNPPRGFTTMVRYPADGMAYVTLARLHPDQTEPLLISGPTALAADIVTLVAEDGAWKVQAVGEMVPPSALGLTAYSW